MTQTDHECVLDMMERLRVDHEYEFYYGIRERDSSPAHRLQRGFVFLGDDNYIWVPLCPLSTPNHTRAFGVVFNVDVGCAYLEIVVPTTDDMPQAERQTLEALKLVIEGLDVTRRDAGAGNVAERHQYQYQIPNTAGTSVSQMVEGVETFLNANIATLLKPLQAHEMAYTKDSMKESIETFLERRAGVSDGLDQRLRGICNSL